jgi:hypothetical protein
MARRRRSPDCSGAVAQAGPALVTARCPGVRLRTLAAGAGVARVLPSRGAPIGGRPAQPAHQGLVRHLVPGNARQLHGAQGGLPPGMLIMDPWAHTDHSGYVGDVNVGMAASAELLGCRGRLADFHPIPDGTLRWSRRHQHRARITPQPRPVSEFRLTERPAERRLQRGEGRCDRGSRRNHDQRIRARTWPARSGPERGHERAASADQSRVESGATVRRKVSLKEVQLWVGAWVTLQRAA